MSCKLPHGLVLLAVCGILAPSPGMVAETCVPIRTFADGKVPAREIFVSPTGNNTTGSGQRSQPFRTLSRALQGVQAGDAIRLLPGNYPAGTFIENLSGTSNAPIWISGVPGQPKPIISGGSEGIHLTRVRHLVLENLEIAGATVNGINCDDGGNYADNNTTRHIDFRALRIRDIGTGGNHDGLKLSGVNDYFVLDCSFERMSAGGSAIDHVGCHQGMIAACSFTDAGSNSIQCKGGSEDIEIRGNRFNNGGARAINIGGSTGFSFFRPPLSTTTANFEARNIRVVANLFRGSEAPIAFVGTIDSLVANNTFIEPTKWVMRILQETLSGGGYTFRACAGNRFQNNLIHFDRTRVNTFVNIGPNTEAGTFQFANNLWYAFNQPNRSQPSLPAAETGGIYGLNPLFQDAASGVYAIRTNSPAVGKGKTPPDPGLDLAGNCYAILPSIGAFETRPRTVPEPDTDGDQLPDVWEAAHGFDPDDPSDAPSDADGDAASNLGEFVASTNPRDPTSVFALRVNALSSGKFSFRFSTASGRFYRVQRRSGPSGAAWSDGAIVAGDGNEFEHVPAEVTGELGLFRVEVELAK